MMNTFDVELSKLELLIQQGELARAQQQCEEHLRSNPNSPEWQNALGIIAMRQGKPKEAIRHFRAAADRPTPHFGATRNLAELLASTGDIDGAISNFYVLANKFNDTSALSRVAELDRYKHIIEQRKALERQCKSQPSSGAFINLGNICYQQGDLTGAERAYKQALKLAPDVYAGLYNLGNLYYVQKKFDLAAEVYRKCIAAYPQSKEPLARLADTYVELKDFDRALDASRRAIEIDPNFDHAHNAAGNALLGLARYADAVKALRTAVEKALNPISMFNLASALHQSDQRDAGVEVLKDTIKHFPHFEKAYASLLNIYFEDRKLDEALEIGKTASDLFPESAEVLMAYARNLSEVLSVDPEDVATVTRRVLELEPSNISALLLLSRMYREMGSVELALDSVNLASMQEPNNPFVLQELGLVYASLGKFDVAEGFFAKAIEIEPDNSELVFGVIMNCSVQPDSPYYAEAQRLARSGGLSDDDQAQMHYLMARQADRLGNYELAVREYQTSKNLRRLQFDIAAHRMFYEELKGAFGADYFSQLEQAQPDDRPVFIIGMPRCGSTLTETIISSHPSVKPLGEIPNLRNIAREDGFNVEHCANVAARMLARRPDELEERASKYKRIFNRHGTPALRYLDKSLHNFELIWQIAALFPSARIIHCRRDPVDTCLSIYQQHFSEFHSYVKDLTTLGEYYLCYEDLMRHWQAVSPIEILELRYEDLVSDLEPNAKRLIAHLGLEWDERCLRFQEAERIVQTASRWQVRQGLYQSSKAKWKKWQPHIDELVNVLKRSESFSHD